MMIALEPKQADLLSRVCDNPLLRVEELRAAGAFALPDVMTDPKGKGKGESQLEP